MSEQIKNKLWNLVDNSNVYSFKENPLDIFSAFAYYYISFSINAIENDSLQNVYNLLEELSAKTNENEEIQKFIQEIVTVLSDEVGNNAELLAEIVDFFADKYSSFEKKDFVLSDNLVDFIYWYAAGEDPWCYEMAIYNPFAGLSNFGIQHIIALKEQLQSEIIDCDKSEETIKWIKQRYKKTPWYSGTEDNPISRLIGNVRLLVNNPINFSQIYTHVGDSTNEEISNFKGGWTMIVTPPLSSYYESSKSDVRLVKCLVDKFINANGMAQAFFVLPKSFCYDNIYLDIRRSVVCRGLLGGVIEVPEKVFKSSADIVIVYLRKSSYECGTRLIDARAFVKDGELDNWALLNVCFGEETESCKTIGDYTFSQCNYCILPSMYLQSGSDSSENKELKDCYIKYKTIIESQAESEKKRVAHRDISGQLSHMLGTTYHKIFDAISELKYVEGLESTYSMLNDNFEYMRRLINSIDDDFSSQSMKLEETEINDFIQKYCSAWKNYGKKQFAVSFESDLNDDTTFKIDEIFMKVMLDAILENANRHGFDGVDIENPQIRIQASYVMINNMPCVLISIANNGASFPNGFTIEQYIREGDFGGAKGRTGRGGYHVYQIVKRHQGYINISNDDEWNVKINIMIPIEYYDECETEKIVKYGEEFM